MDKNSRFPLAQQTVLGSMLIDPDCIGDVLAELTPDDFDEGPLREVFVAMQQLFSAGKPIDGVTTVTAMGKSDVPEYRSFANCRAYIRIVKSQGKLSRLHDLGKRLTNAPEIEEAADIVAQINAASVSQKTTVGCGVKELLEGFYDRQTEKRSYIPTGFQTLDAGLYMEPGDFVVLAGYPSDGKTALALQLAYFQAEKMKVGFFSLETSPAKLFDRLISLVTSTPLSDIKRQRLQEQDYRRIINYNQELQAHQLEIIPAAGWTVSDVASYSRAHRFDVIYADYLQLIRGIGKSRFEQVTSVSLGLHTFAQQAKTVVVALSQLSRETKGNDRSERPPRLSDLRESGQIEQDADAVLLLYREDPDKLDSRRILRIAKNKEGTTGAFPAVFNGQFQNFQIGQAERQGGVE